ncbi:MAG: metal ABC transporter ATP-binding protein [Desulfovibrio sp.]
MSTTTQMPAAVHFQDVSLTLGNNDILDKINISVQEGTLHFIIGPNGGGKTSLLRCLLGQMPHTGTISIFNTKKAVTGYVPQVLHFDHTLPMTVEDFMAVVCQNFPVFMGLHISKAQIVDEVLKKVGMHDKKKYPFGGLSGGERQRILLAQALIPKPELLILDEPATGLDKEGTAIIHEIIQELRDEGTTVILVHHDLGIVQEMADTVTCINKQVLFSGPPEIHLTHENLLSIYSHSTAPMEASHSQSARN